MASPNQSENTLLIATNSINTIATDSVTSGILSELSTALDELSPLASKVADLKKETLAKEAAVLKAILEKATPLVPLLSEDCELQYRREIVIQSREERIQLEEGFGIFSENRLVLYENGLLARTHRYGEWSEGSRPGWENTDEDVLTPEAAITTFGFTAISKGLVNVFGETSWMATLKEELEGRLAALTEAHEAMR